MQHHALHSPLHIWAVIHPHDKYWPPPNHTLNVEQNVFQSFNSCQGRHATWWFPEIGLKSFILNHFNRIFHKLNHPSILGCPKILVGLERDSAVGFLILISYNSQHIGIYIIPEPIINQAFPVEKSTPSTFHWFWASAQVGQVAEGLRDRLQEFRLWRERFLSKCLGLSQWISSTLFWRILDEFRSTTLSQCFWLVVWTPLKNISQLGWLATQYMGK